MPAEIPKPLTSWRGVSFYVKSHEIQVGRRVTLHAVPFEDTGVRANDVGRAPREFSFTAVFIGRNYRIERDKLLDALEMAGPGLLVHPEFGSLQCYADKRSSMRETTSAIGKAELSFTLIEAADDPEAKRTKAAAFGAVKEQKLKGFAVAERVFVKRIGYPALSDFLDASRIGVLEKTISDLRGVNGAIGTALSVPSGYAAQIDALSANLTSLVSTPRRVFTSITAIMDEIAQGFARVTGIAGWQGNYTQMGSYFTTTRSLGAFAVAARAAALLGAVAEEWSPPTTTPERVKQTDETNAIQTTMRTAMLLSLAAVVPDMPLDSTEDARAIRTDLIDSMLAVADADDTDVDLSNALRDAAAGLSAHLRDLEALFTTYEPGHPLPAEVIAHLLYGDPERADEIIARNRPADPGAMQGRHVIEVKRA